MGFNSAFKGLMYELKKIGKVFTSKLVGTGPSSYEKSIYRVAVSQSLINTGLHLFISFRNIRITTQCSRYISV